MENKIKQRRTKEKDTLHAHESLLIWRRRKNWTQGKAAKHFGLSVFKYKQAEYYTVSGFKYEEHYKFSELSDSEKCLIYRKRAQITQCQLAMILGMSRHGLRLQENGKVKNTKLLNYWEHDQR